jgi:hypothetical protein
MDDVEVALDSQASKPHDPQPVSRKLTPDGVNRNKGNPQSYDHRLLDCLCVTELHGRFDVPAGSLKGTLGDLAGGGPLFTDEQPLTFEQRWLDLAPPSPRMARRHDEDELVEEPGCDALFTEPERVSSDHPKIELVPTDLLFDEGGVRNA